MDHSERAGRAEQAKEKLQTDFEKLVRDAKALLEASAEEADEKTRDARERLSKTLDEAREKWLDAESRLQEKAEEVDRFVKQKPYQAVGISLIAGIFLGWLFSRK